MLVLNEDIDISDAVLGAANRDLDVAAALVGVIGLYSDYYFTNTVVRPTLGGGFALLTQASADVSVGSQALSGAETRGSALAFVPRVGLNLGRFGLMYAYHISFNEQVASFSSLNWTLRLFGGKY